MLLFLYQLIWYSRKGGSFMKINEIIRSQRIKLGLTQEQIASYLGVSAPAVNKWEKGNSYPDITLLPPLARLLKTDLNTLLSFQDSLTLQEINFFTQQLVAAAKENGIRYAYQIAMEKIQEYPSCDELILSSALTLEGYCTMYLTDSTESLDANDLEPLYERATRSNTVPISEQAKSMLIYKYMGRNEYEKAKDLLDTLSESPTVDKIRIQTNLFIEQKDYSKASLLIEQRMLKESTELYSDLIKLMEIAQEENRIEDATYLCQTSKQLSQLFCHWEYNQYVPEFQLSIVQKDAPKCVAILKNMLPALLKEWRLNQTPLYQHLESKNLNKEMGKSIMLKIIKELQNTQNSEYAFLHKDINFQSFLTSFKAQENI